MQKSKTQKSSIKVCVRVRPLINNEKHELWKVDQLTQHIWCDGDGSIEMEYEISRRGHTKILENGFTFDNVAGSYSKTKEVYQMIGQPIVKKVVNGYNGTIFLYGQTTSGKTYTMLGNKNDPGILPYAIKDLFYEINTPGRGNLRIVEDKQDGVQVQGANKEQVWSFDQVIQLMNYGQEHRKYRANHMHDHSSRSHTIFRIILQSQTKEIAFNKKVKVKISTLNLVDLAGSERLKDIYNDCLKKEQRGETRYINKSLFTLANVIKKLAQGGCKHVPYRDSKLTRLLSQSLGGNSVTAVVCNISPASCNFFQTLSTLKFAQRAKRVQNKPILNEVQNQEDEEESQVIQKLKKELQAEKRVNISLKKELKGKEIENNELRQGILVLKSQQQDLEDSQSFKLRDIGNITRSTNIKQVIENALNEANLINNSGAIPLIKDLQSLIKKYSSISQTSYENSFQFSVIETEPQNEQENIPELFQEQSKKILQKFESYEITSQVDLDENIQTFTKLYAFNLKTLEDQYSSSIKTLEEQFSQKITKFTENNQKENFDDQTQEVLLYQITFEHKQLLEKLKVKFQGEQTKIYEIFGQVIQIINMILPKNINSIIFPISSNLQELNAEKIISDYQICPSPKNRDKHVWVWGSGKEGRLGTGREDDEIQPYNLKK